MSSSGRRYPRMSSSSVGGSGRRSKRQKDNINGTSTGKSSDSAAADAVREVIRDDNVPVATPVLLNGTEIGKELVCACCMDIIIQATAVVPCGHTFCNPCLFQSIEKCPTCRHNVLGTIPNRTVNNAIQELIRLQQQEIQQQQQKQSATTRTTQTRRGTITNVTTSEPTTTTSATSFFSTDDIQSYHERVRDAPPERTLEVSCRRSSGQNRYRPAMMSTNAQAQQAQHNFRRRNGVWELVANSDDDDDEDDDDDDDDDNDDDDDEENTVFDDFVDNEEIQWLRQQEGDVDAVDPFAIDFGLFGNPNAAVRAGNNNRNPYFFELLLGSPPPQRRNTPAAATVGQRGPRMQQEQQGAIANRRREETRQRRQSALQQLAASRRRVQQRNNNAQDPHRDIIDDTTRRVLAGMNLSLDPPPAQRAITNNRTNNAASGTVARNNRSAPRQRQPRERLQPPRAVAAIRNNNPVNNEIQLVNRQPEVRRIVRSTRAAQPSRGPNVVRGRQAVEVIVPNVAPVSITDARGRRRPRSPSPIVVGRRVLRSNSSSAGPSRIRARISGRSNGSPIEIE